MAKGAQMARRLRGILFDKEGTLFDFHATWGVWCGSFIQDMAQGDPARAKVLADAIGFDLGTGRLHKSSPVVAETMEALLALVLRSLPDLNETDLRRHLITSSAAAPQVQVVPLVALLDRLQNMGLTLGIATNDGEEPARAHLERAGIIRHFAFIAGYDTGHGGKPDPGMALAFCRVTGLEPEECAMIGDSNHDLISGRTAGMRAVGVLTGLASREDLAPHADAILPDIGGLPGWLASEQATASG
jgi:phosphoglycolate phosphatase